MTKASKPIEISQNYCTIVFALATIDNHAKTMGRQVLHAGRLSYFRARFTKQFNALKAQGPFTKTSLNDYHAAGKRGKASL